MPTVFFHTNSPLGTTTLTSSRQEFFQQKNTFCKKTTQMNRIQYLDLFVTYRVGFKMNIGNENPIVFDESLSFIQQSKSSTLGLTL